MQVFTIPPTPVISSHIVSKPVPGGAMIQSQPINLATTNSGLTARATSAFERVDTRKDIIPAHSARTLTQNHSEHQAQDLSMHYQQQHQLHSTIVKIEAEPTSPGSTPVGTNTLLDFCNIILNYTNYPEAFHDDVKYNPRQQTNGNKWKPKGLRKLETGDDMPLRPAPRKRKAGNPTTTIKQKPGRKPKVPKFSAGPPAPATGIGPTPRLRAVAMSVPSQQEHGARVKLEDVRMHGNRRRERKVSSPLNSVGESREGTHSSSSSTSSHVEERHGQGANLFYPDDVRDESWEQVTCFCGKPFAGRPMIECENCFVWHHMSCAKLRKTNVPEKFYCRDCKPLFPDFVRERPRRTSGNSNNNNLGAGTVSHYPKNPVKKNRLPSGGNLDATAPLALTIPNVVQRRSSQDHQLISPRGSTSSQLSPQEDIVSQLRSDANTSPYSVPTLGQFKVRNQSYLTGTAEVKPVQQLAKLSPTLPLPKKPEEKTPKRRPTLNSASSGLYDDILLTIKLEK